MNTEPGCRLPVWDAWFYTFAGAFERGILNAAGSGTITVNAFLFYQHKPIFATVVFLFRDKSIANIFFLALLSVGVHLHFLVNAPLIDTNNGNNDGLFTWILDRYIVGLPASVMFIIYHALVLVQAVRLNMVLNELRMFQTYNYTAAMSYILLSAILTQWCSISAALVSNSLLIWIFINLSRLYNHPMPKALLFNTGLIIGLTVICYHTTAILILVVFFALAVVRPFRLAEWLILLMGALLPYYFVFSYLFLTNQLSTYRHFLPAIHPGRPVYEWNSLFVASLSFITLLLLAGLYYWQDNVGRMVIQIRKNWSVMLVMLLVLLPVPFIFQQAGIESAVMCLVPIGAFSANAFSAPRRYLLPNLLFWAAVGIIIFNNISLLKN